jgi:hypothetical protein
MTMLNWLRLLAFVLLFVSICYQYVQSEAKIKFRSEIIGIVCFLLWFSYLLDPREYFVLGVVCMAIIFSALRLLCIVIQARGVLIYRWLKRLI